MIRVKKKRRLILKPEENRITDLSLQDLPANSNSSSLYLRCERVYCIEALFGQQNLFFKIC